MRAAALSLLLLGAAEANILWENVCTQSDVKGSKWCDITAEIDVRAEAFVKTLQLEEKAGIMINNGKGVERLHLPPYQWGSEGLHGPLQPCVNASDGTTKCPTSFPAPCAMASAFNDTMYHYVGAADGREARAINNLRNHATQNVYGDGIDYWSPTVNMQRDPRWGRNQEVPGEDPMLTGQYAVNFLQGIQFGEDPKHTQIVGTCKHFVANSMENWYNYSRHNYDAMVSKTDLADYYFPAFKACVMEGEAMSIMCSYNAVNGVPMCANTDLLNGTLRNSWKFQGYVTSDCGAVQNVWTPEPKGHGYTDKVRATAISVIAGTDIDCGKEYSTEFGAAVAAGELTEAQIDLALTRLTKAWLRLGLFDPKADQPYFQLGGDVIDSAEHQQLAHEAAQQAIVLLKNDGGVLPLKPGGKVAVVGPHFNVTDVMISNYHGSRCPDNSFDCIPTPFDMIKSANAGGETTGVQGCEVDSERDDIAAAVAAAKDAETVVMVMGIGQHQEREGQDRYNTTLPGLQIRLAEQVLALGKPTVLVLIHGGAMSLGPLKDKYPAIVDAFYGGEMGGVAIADVLYGKYNPSGKLAVTMYPPDFVNQLPLNDMSVRTPPGRTHMYYTGTPEFAFGTGLSYTTFGLEMIATPAETVEVAAAGELTYTLLLSHRGGPPGRRTILAFWRPRAPRTEPGMVPLKQKLFGYGGAHLSGAGEQATLTFTLKADALAVADVDGHKMLHAGDGYDIVFTDGHDLRVTAGLRTTGVGARVVEPYPMN